jgi:hypothetical protein
MVVIHHSKLNNTHPPKHIQKILFITTNMKFSKKTNKGIASFWGKTNKLICERWKWLSKRERIGGHKNYLA